MRGRPVGRRVTSWAYSILRTARVRPSAEERRILLTQNKALVEREAVTHGCCVRESNPRLQLDEILPRFDL